MASKRPNADIPGPNQDVSKPVTPLTGSFPPPYSTPASTGGVDTRPTIMPPHPRLRGGVDYPRPKPVTSTGNVDWQMSVPEPKPVTMSTPEPKPKMAAGGSVVNKKPAPAPARLKKRGVPGDPEIMPKKVKARKPAAVKTSTGRPVRVKVVKAR